MSDAPFWGLPGTNIPLPVRIYNPRENSLFAVARQEMVRRQFDWLGQEFYICLCDDTVEFDAEQETGWTVAQEASIIMRIGPLSGKTDAGGYCAARDVTMAGVTTHRDIHTIVMMRYASGNAPNIPVVLFTRIYGAPTRLKNEDFVMRWDRSFGGIFRP